jgi:hypothetical protein
MVPRGKVADGVEMVKAKPFLLMVLPSIWRYQGKMAPMAQMAMMVMMPIAIASHEMLTTTYMLLMGVRAAMVAMAVMGVMAVR